MTSPRNDGPGRLVTVDVRRKPWFLALARRYVRRRFRREFDGFHVEGLERIRRLAAREPVIVASTHVAWWDALFAIQMDWLLGTETYCLMDADNLRRLPFFGWVGAVPLDRSSPKQALRDMKAAAREIVTCPSSRGCRITSRTLRANSGSSSRKSTP